MLQDYFRQTQLIIIYFTSSPTFVADLEGRIRSPYTRISYDLFDETNIANFASINNGNGTKSVFCVYTIMNIFIQELSCMGNF